MRRHGGGALLIGLVIALTAPSAYASPSFVPAGKSFGFTGAAFPSDQPAGSMQTLDAAQAAGAEYLRGGISWRAYERDTHYTRPIPPSFSKPVGQPTGHWETDRVDKIYLALKARGMKMVLMILNAPDWASTFHTCLTNPLVAADPKKCPKDWKTKALMLYPATDRFDSLRAFVSAVARRYPDALIEGTNEPDWHKEFAPHYHPPVSTVALGQCALAGAVRAVDPTRPVLSPGLYQWPYLQDFINAIGKNHNCFTHLSTHIFGSTEVRGGFASSVQDTLDVFRLIMGPGKRMFITETSLSDTVSYNDVKFNELAEQTGERLVSRAYPRWLDFFLSQPDIDGLLIHTVRQQSPGTTGDQNGYGILKYDFTVKDSGPDVLSRWCYLVLSAGNSYPGCEGKSLPPPPTPSAPSFFKPPHLIFSSDTGVGDRTRVIMLEEGHPLPTVRVTWYRCNAVGANCQGVFFNKTTYVVQPGDRFNRLKVVVTLTNPSGSTTGATVMSPVITE